MNIAYSLVFFILMSGKSFASGYRGDLEDAWHKTSIAVLGCPKMERKPWSLLHGEPGIYTIYVEKAYKGGKTGSSIKFIDKSFRSTASLHIQEESRYLVLIQTQDDRKKRPYPGDEKLGNAMVGLRVYKVNDANLAELEAGIATVKEYASLAQQDQKAFLLQNLTVKNKYTHTLIVREILKARIKEAIPYFQQRLSQATNEGDKLRIISKLRCLGDPGVKAIYLSWLADNSFQRKWEIIEEMVRLKDKSLIPIIRKYVYSKDEHLAVTARSALLRLGEPDGKKLLLEMIKTSEEPLIRYNAIHYLNWNYSEDFTEKEKKTIKKLVRDKDKNIARVAGFIVEKWTAKKNKAKNSTSQSIGRNKR